MIKHRILTIAIFLITISPMNFAPLAAQNPPASTYKPGFWQPVARVDTRLPIEIQLINQTDTLLEYDLTTNQKITPISISPGDTAILKEFTIPAYILINSGTLASNTTPFNLKFDVTATNNKVTVNIQKVGEETPGNTTLNLHETGAIYIY